MGGFLVIKLVKPTKVFSRRRITDFSASSCRPGRGRRKGKRYTSSAESVCRCGHELAGFDALDRVLNQAAKFLSLLVGDGGFEVLNFDQLLADEDDLSHVGDARDPGVADQLRIEG